MSDSPAGEPTLDAQEMETLLQSIGFNVDIAHIAAPWLVTNGFDKAYLLDTTKWDERDRTAFRALEGINGGHMAQLNRFTPVKTFLRLQALPNLAPCASLISSGSSNPIKHQEARFKEHGFAVLNAELLDQLKSKEQGIPRIVEELGSAVHLEWSGEDEIKDYVKEVLKDALQSAQLRDHVKCRGELGLIGIRADVWLVFYDGIPIGAVEVKKPGKRVMSNAKVHGQIFDYLMQLQQNFGIQSPFGIITTYEKWRVVWLPEALPLAGATTLEKGNLVVGAAEQLPTPQRMPPSPKKAAPRVIHGCQVVSNTSPELPSILVSVVLKMAYSKRVPLQLFDKNRKYIVFNSESYEWDYLPDVLNALNFASMPPKVCKVFYLLHDLRGGIDGRAWLACATNGMVCVLKFYHEPDETKIGIEVDIWKNVWGFHSVRSQRINNYIALVMPYVKPCETPTEAEKQLTKAAVNKLAQAQFLHNDLGWRHVGFYVDASGKDKAALFDLTHVKTDVDPDEAKTAMLRALSL